MEAVVAERGDRPSLKPPLACCFMHFSGTERLRSRRLTHSGKILQKGE
ncbi:MAG: hypothetical protein HC886_17605 [Leptolyngbyaceae cyanobacterium SM1_1_3]|nr:hypothetical protein [Leptolyngbyaceae cyanobacterium SM1_1_3]NJO11105.1 hypothetical protein [Leptolyngbyaceae cyanobacterium SL_1_1]